jgi:RNA polymerase sigma-70 factor (ECF subfamily)
MTDDANRRRRFETVAAEVFDPLQRYLRRRASAEDAADAFAETMLVVWRRLDDVPQERPLPWCYGVARRTLANQRRGRRRQLRLVQRLAAEPIYHTAEPGGDPALEIALESLPDDDRELLTLWAWEDLEPREIAEVLGLTANAVSLRLTRAKKKLAKLLERQNEPSPGHKGDDTPESDDE